MSNWEHGRLYLNGVVVERTPMAVGGHLYREILPNGRSYVIAEISDSEFSRDRSNDSRFPEFGTIPLSAMVGKASIVWMSGDWRQIGKTLQPDP